MARQKKRKRNSLGNGLAILGMTMVIAVLAFSVYVRSQTLREQEAAYIQQEDTLNKQIKSEEDRTDQLEERKKYVTTKQYIEEIAREKLGLVDPDEVILKESDQK